MTYHVHRTIFHTQLSVLARSLKKDCEERQLCIGDWYTALHLWYFTIFHV